MLSWRIFRRAVTLIIDDLGGALRVSALPFAIFAAVSLVFAGGADMAALSDIDTSDPEAVASIPPGLIGGVLASALAQLVTFLWIAVAWHRYVLLREDDGGWVPRLEAGRMLGYLGRSLLIGLLILAAVTVVFVALAAFLPGVAAALATIIAMVLTYRLGLILPAGAIGKPITIFDAWRATLGQSATVILLALMTFGVSLLLQVPAFLDAGSLAGEPDAAAAPGPVAVVYGLVVTWIVLMLGTSLLSTLYGHFVEDRPLD